jgi:hypothetical protein
MTRAIGNLVATWANSQIEFTGIGMNVNATAYHANSRVLRLKLNGNELLSLDANGNIFLSSNANAGNVSVTGALNVNGRINADSISANTAYVDSIDADSLDVTGNVIAGNVGVTGALNVNGRINADSITINTALANLVSASYIAANVITANVMLFNPMNVANLPVASVVGSGAKAMVNDANNTTFASRAFSGGSNVVPVTSNGSFWRVG